jgi:ribosomal-protein-alanine N-acetyltransferase
MLDSPYSFGLLAELKSGQLSGYLVARAIDQEGEILNLAVAPERRRNGLGGKLLEAGLDALKTRGVADVFLEVRASNEAAIAMYLAHGFRPMGRRQEYYRKPVEDAMVLRRAIGDR